MAHAVCIDSHGFTTSICICNIQYPVLYKATHLSVRICSYTIRIDEIKILLHAVHALHSPTSVYLPRPQGQQIVNMPLSNDMCSAITGLGGVHKNKIFLGLSIFSLRASTSSAYRKITLSWDTPPRLTSAKPVVSTHSEKYSIRITTISDKTSSFQACATILTVAGEAAVIATTFKPTPVGTPVGA
jgi:hypothetical protein